MTGRTRRLSTRRSATSHSSAPISGENQLDVAKYTPLVGQGAVSKQQLDDAVQATHASEAQVQASEAALENARLNLGWTKIYSPIDGIAGIAPVQVGDLVTPSTVLTTVSQVDPMKVTFPISEREYLRYATRSKEHQEKGRASDEPDLQSDPRERQHVSTDRTFLRHQPPGRPADRDDPGAGPLPNPDGILRPGLYAKVRAPTETVKGAFVVPARAVQETQGVYQVAVVGSDDKVELRTVKAGEQVDGLWIINDGLKAGERVVTQGTPEGEGRDRREPAARHVGTGPAGGAGARAG
jgi:membrane fusion protein (multidrug efflux system)